MLPNFTKDISKYEYAIHKQVIEKVKWQLDGALKLRDYTIFKQAPNKTYFLSRWHLIIPIIS